MFVLMAAMKAIAQNPVVQTWYTSDPAPMVFGDRIYMIPATMKTKPTSSG